MVYADFILFDKEQLMVAERDTCIASEGSHQIQAFGPLLRQSADHVCHPQRWE